MPPDIHSELQCGLEAAGVPGQLAERVAEYGARLLDENARVNLTGAKTAAELLPHLLDSLTVAPHIETSLIDIGSGGGLPAIPLAIATGIRITMIESTAKKARFLEKILAEFQLEGQVVAERAEVLAHDPVFREQFQSATARAVSSAPTVAELTLPFLLVDGIAALQRGSLEERELHAVEDAAVMLGGQLEKEIRLEGERRILLLRKTGTTSERFPRRTGIPEKRPLCM